MPGQYSVKAVYDIQSDCRNPKQIIQIFECGFFLRNNEMDDYSQKSITFTITH